MALWHRSRAGQPVDGLIHHSDAGSQYTAIRYTDRLADAGALASIGSVGDSYDNARRHPVNPPRNDIETTTSTPLSCPTCGAGYTRTRRQRYCSPACRQAA